jgi:hypothetical protein
MLASSRDSVTPRIRPDNSTKKTKLTRFFTSRKLLVLDTLPKGQKYDHDYLVQKVIPELQCERSRFARRKTLVEFAAHLDNSICHNGTKVTNALDKANVIQAPHAVYSPELSPCDFWLFGTLRHRITERQLQSAKEILGEFTEL